MTGQAGVWMLLVLFLCLCTSTVQADFFSPYSGGGGDGFSTAAYDCCSQSLDQGKALISGQDQIQQILFNKRNALQKVNDDVQSIKNDTATVLQNQAISQGLIGRCQSQVLTNISIVQDSQGALQENMTKFQDFVRDGIGKLQATQNQTLFELREARAAVEQGVKSEHEATRALVTQTGNSIQTTLAELKGILEKVHASIGALTELVQACCNRRVERKDPRSTRSRNPYFLY